MTNYIEQHESPRYPHQRLETERLMESVRNDATITDGVMRWHANDNVPPQEVVEFAKHIGLDVDVEKSAQVRTADFAKFAASYRKIKRTPEQESEAAFERRAAFGPGADVVDVISGRRYRT